MLKDKIEKLFEGYGHHPLAREPRVGDTYRNELSGKIYRYTREEGTRVWLQEKDKRGREVKLHKVPRDGFEDDINLGNLELIDSEPVLGKGVETSDQATQDKRIAKMHKFTETTMHSSPMELYKEYVKQHKLQGSKEKLMTFTQWNNDRLNQWNPPIARYTRTFESKGSMKQMVESLFQMDWPIYSFKHGKLWDEDGNPAFDRTFTSATEAEKWLYDEDIRGTVKGADEWSDEMPPEMVKDAEEYHEYQMKNDPEYAADAIRRSKMTPQQVNMEDEDLPPGVGR